MNNELRNFRLSQNQSIKGISDYIGVSKSMYEKVEYSQRAPSYNFIKKFKQKYPQCDTDILFFINTYT